MSEWRSRYHGEGVLVYWHVETGAVCIYSQLRSFSSSEVAAMIEGLVRHDTEMRVEKNFVDSHGQSGETQYEVNDGLQVVENWNSTNEFICYGRQGEFATNSREQQEATTLSLQLLQNCLMLINTILIQRTIDRQGPRLQPEDFRALTPLFYGHINPYGAFELDLEGPSFLEAA
jgi:TnpA family transposase